MIINQVLNSGGTYDTEGINLGVMSRTGNRTQEFAVSSISACAMKPMMLRCNFASSASEL